MIIKSEALTQMEILGALLLICVLLIFIAFMMVEQRSKRVEKQK